MVTKPVFTIPETITGFPPLRPAASGHVPPPGATATLVELLTKPPVCTVTDTWHPCTPSGMVNAITSQAAIPCGIGKLGLIPPQQAPRPADTTVACVVPTQTVMLVFGTPVAPLCVSSLVMAPRPVPLIITVCAACTDW